MTAKYHAVLFDFDYTLGDTERGIVASTRYALEQMGLPQPPEEAIRRTIGLTLERSFTALTGSSDPAEQAKFSRLFNEKAEEVMVDSAVFYPGARELVDWLQASGTAVGVVTDKNRPRIAAILHRAGIAPAVLVSAQDARPKPAPDGILLAANSLGLKPEEILYIGDSCTDEAAAAAAGCDFIALTTGATRPAQFARPQPGVPVWQPCRSSWNRGESDDGPTSAHLCGGGGLRHHARRRSEALPFPAHYHPGNQGTGGALRLSAV